jgi:hypothetical protein
MFLLYSAIAEHDRLLQPTALCFVRKENVIYITSAPQYSEVMTPLHACTALHAGVGCLCLLCR